MATAIKEAKGEIVISIDSDTFIDPDTIHNLIMPFDDPKVDGVSGHIDVANPKENMLTKFQEPIYYMGFRVFKAAEQGLGSITCLSGCLLAFKKTVILPVLQEWIDQNKKYFSGEDRALTTLLLRNGGKLVYQDNAHAKTLVPTKFRTYIRQQLRWKRSWFTENFRTAIFIWRKPYLAMNILALLFLSLLAPVVVFREMLILPLIDMSPLRPLMFLFGLCCLGVFYGSYQMLLGGYTKEQVGYTVVGCLLYVVLVWQIPYALLTLKDSRWLTRQ